MRSHIVAGMLQHGVTALYLATSSGYVAIVRLLLENKADPNICNKVQYFICSVVQWSVVVEEEGVIQNSLNSVPTFYHIST